MRSDGLSTIYEFGEFRLDKGKRLLFQNGEVISLTPKVFDTLLYLAEHGGRVVDKNELMREIWSDTIVEENNLNKNISVLRRVLGEKPGEHRYIVTVPGHGYKFVADVRRQDRSLSGPAEKTDVAGESLPSQTHQRSNEKPRWVLPLVGFGLLAIIALGAYLWRANTTVRERSITSIAVLPFKPLVADNRNEALELGMADALIAKLSGVEEITVRPLSAVRRFDALEQDTLEAGRELAVESVLEGTIQTSDDRVRVSARLVRTADGRQLWTDQFDEKFVDIFTVQDSISRRVADALKIKLGGGERKHPTENIEAYQLYIKGRFHILKLRPSETQKGEAYFRQAIELDPNYALAYVGIANANRSFTMAGEMNPTEFMPKGIAAAERAIAIDPTLADGHAELCYLLLRYEWNWKKAEKSCTRALEIDPNNAEAYHAYAHVYSITGRYSDGLRAIRRARELDPLNLRISGAEAQFLIGAGHVDEAVAKLQKSFELDPDFWFTHNFMSSAYIEKGMYNEAIAEARMSRDLSGGATQPTSFLGFALAKAGREAEARAEAEGLISLSKKRYVPPYNVAMIYNGLEETDKAIAWLERGLAERDPRMIFLTVEPKWNNLRGDKRFIDLMTRIGFE